MTEAEVKKVIAARLPSDTANSEETAGSYLKMAVLKLGRMENVDWNRVAVQETLTAGQKIYEVGVDILRDYKDVKNIQSLWHTDRGQDPIDMVDVYRFNKTARGGQASGRPFTSTIHSDEAKIEFYPSPDSAYTIWAYVRKKIENFEDIPSEYHDVLLATALAYVASPRSFSAEGLKEMRDDSRTEWGGSTIQISRNIGRVSNRRVADSHNLQGD